ncbi:MBL fold metallo-hydrolase [Spirosoma koreense]
MAGLQSITPSLYQLSLGTVNAFVIKDDGLTLIDTGYSDSLATIFSLLQKQGENPYAIKQVILTHAHPDHAGSASAIKDKLGIPLLAHQLEAPLLEAGSSGRSPIYPSPGLVNWLIYQFFVKGGDGSIPPVGVDERLSHNDVIPVAGGLQVIHTPGHSVGHMALWLKEEGVMIAGDTCANLMGLSFSTVYEDRSVGLRSILAMAERPFDQAVFGHGAPLKPQASQKIKAKFKPLAGR